MASGAEVDRRATLIEEPRLFVAVPLAEEARAAVEQLVDAIRVGEPAGRGVRWVRLDGLHLTLRFLGPTPEERIPGIVDAMAAAARAIDPFSIRVSGAGSFPPVGRPRTLWLSIAAGDDRLTDLAARLDEGLAAAGWERERRPFQAHLTLARADGVRAGPATATALAAAAANVSIASPIDRIVLFESITGSGRARYLERAEVPLGGSVTDGASMPGATIRPSPERIPPPDPKEPTSS